MSEGYFMSAAAVDQVEIRPGVLRRTLATTDRTMLCEFTLTSGAAVATHSHPHDQLGYVVSGQLEFTLGDQTRVCGPGDTYAVPGDVPHSAVALSDCLLVEVFTPPREEFR
jgi:quercetin dioxygenase-like cupin family protein